MSVDLQSWVQASEIIRNLGIIVGGAVGIWLAWRRASAATRQADAQLDQARLGRRDHVAELFNRAVGQLTEAKLEVRLGAIFTLRQICLDFPDLSRPVIRLLTTYLRENKVGYGQSDLSIDVQEIVEILREYRES